MSDGSAASGVRWDGNNRRFDYPLVCPHAGCGAGQTLPAPNVELSTCGKCGRPFEIVRMRTDIGQMTWTRRADALFCTRTGQRIEGHSPIDWSGEGGDPGRASCRKDVGGALLGRATPSKTVELAGLVWTAEDLRSAERGVNDVVSSVSMVRGHVVALTRGGRIGVFHGETGALRGEILTRVGERANLEPSEVRRSVSWAPAFSGTTMMLATPLCAFVWNLDWHIFPDAQGQRSSERVIEASLGAQFIAPPLAAEGDRLYFCLVEQRERETHKATIRLFGLDGTELAQLPDVPIACPPVFDAESKSLLWIDQGGWVFRLPMDPMPIAADVNATDVIQMGAPNDGRLLQLGRDLGPRLVIASDHKGGNELWVANQQGGGTLVLYHTGISDVIGGNWAWMERVVDCGSGDLQGLAISHGGYAGEPSIIAVSTDRDVLVFAKEAMREPPDATMLGPEGAGLRGSREAPVITPGGALARLKGTLKLETANTPWARHASEVRMDGRYDWPQGLALYGRYVIAGCEQDVSCFVLGTGDAR